MDLDNVSNDNKDTNPAMDTSDTDTDTNKDTHADSHFTHPLFIPQQQQKPKHILLLPPELLAHIATHLSHHDLTVCVLVSQTWFTLFSPHLWRTIKPYPSQSYNWGYPLADIWFYRFCASVDAGALDRNGHLVRSLSTKYHSVIDLLWVLNRITGGLNGSSTMTGCTELRELIVESEANPKVPTPTQDLNAFFSSAIAFGGEKTAFRRKKHSGGFSGRSIGGGVAIGEGVAFSRDFGVGGFGQPFGAGLRFKNNTGSTTSGVVTPEFAFGNGSATQESTSSISTSTSTTTGSIFVTTENSEAFSLGSNSTAAGAPGSLNLFFGVTPASTPSTPNSSTSASMNIGLSASKTMQPVLAPTLLPTMPTSVESDPGVGTGLDQQGIATAATISDSTPPTTAISPTAAAAAAAAAAESLTPTNAFSGFGSFSHLAVTAPTPATTVRRLSTAPVQFTKPFTPTPSFGGIITTTSTSTNNSQPFVFGSGSTTKTMSFTDVYGPGVRDFKQYPLACLSSGDSPVRSKAALIWLLRQNPKLDTLSIKGVQFLCDFFKDETAASSAALGEGVEATVAGILGAVPRSVKRLILHHGGLPLTHRGRFRQYMDRRSHNGRYNTNRISISSSSGGGGSGSGNGSETAVSATSIRPLDLPILDSLEMLTLLGPLQDSLSYLLLNRIPMLRTLWIAFGDSTVPTFFPSSCDDNNSNNNNSLPQTLRDGCPNLVDLIVEGSISDNHLAWMLAKASARGWRTLIFKSENNILGLESVYAILEHAASTLETIRFGNSGPSFQSHHVQELLCTASNLVRFVGLVGDRTEEKDVELKVEEVFGGGPGGRRNLKNENWACLALEEFRCKITGIPRPDVKTRTNGRPLTDHPLHSDTLYTLEDSYRIQRQVYTQLGRLYKLKYLSLGSDCFYTDKSRYDIDKFLRAEREREGQYYSTTFVQAGFQDECLSMTLASGLELMGGLKELRMLEVSGMRIAGEFWEESEEKKWIKTAWPKVELVCSSGSRRECGAYWKQFGY